MADQQSHHEKVTQAIKNIGKSIEILAPYLASALVDSKNISSIPVLNNVVRTSSLKENTNNHVNSSSIALPLSFTSPPPSVHSKDPHVVDPLDHSNKDKSLRSEKDPNAPRKPSTPFLIFCSENRSKLRLEKPSLTNKEFLIEMGVLWKNHPDKEKYKKSFEELKKQYQQDLNAYNNEKNKENKITEPKEMKKIEIPEQQPIKQDKLVTSDDQHKKEKKKKRKKIEDDIKIDSSVLNELTLNQQFTSQFSTDLEEVEKTREKEEEKKHKKHKKREIVLADA